MSDKKWLFTDNGARWKRNTKFENRLSFLADQSELFKKIYVGYYKLIDRNFYLKGLPFINKQIDLFYKQNGYLPFSRKRIITDMVYSLHRFGAMFDEYFLFKFYEKNAYGRDEFICDKYRFLYYRQLNQTANRGLFDNKNETYNLFKKYYGREVLFCQEQNDLSRFIEFVKNNNSFIIKPSDSSGGRGVKKVSVTEANAQEVFSQELATGKFIAEEIINQSDVMAKLHPASVNTVRVFTVVCKNEIKLFSCFLRVGRGNAVIDNAFAGGIIVAVDEKSGVTYSVGRTESYETFLYHPDTSLPLVGFKLPDWEGAISLCKELASVVKGNRCIGWDIAHTDKGWVMVEGNCRGQLGLQQIPDGTGKKKQLLDMINDF